jgi:putative hydrolase of the HAD superfamily
MRDLLVDFGEVISRPQPPELVAAMASLLGLQVPTFAERYWEHRREYDRGETARAFWSQVARRELGDDGVLERLIALDNESWSQLNEETLAVLADAHGRGHSLSLLSNAPHEFAAATVDHPALADFDHIIFSSWIGVVKPEPGAFQAAVETLARPPDQIVFIDDRAVNVEAAIDAGLHAIRFTSAAELRAALEHDDADERA